MKTRPKIAIIGLGTFGQLHAETLRGLGEADLVAVSEVNAAEAERLAQAWAVPHVFASADELLSAKVADAVIIATRTDTHVPLAARAMRQGLDVLVEKPAGRTAAELVELAEVQARTGRRFMVDHICLFHSLVAPLIERVERKGFRSAHFVRQRSAASGRKYREETPLEMVMVHDLYVAARLAGGAEPVHFEITESRNPDGRIDLTWVLLRWADGRVATFHASMALPDGTPEDGWDELEILGADYHARIETNPAPWTWTDARPTRPVSLEISSVHGRPTGMLAEMQRSFLAALRGAPVPAGCRLEDALQLQRWTERLQQLSTERNRC